MPCKPKNRGRIVSQAVIVLTETDDKIVHAYSHGDGDMEGLADNLMRILRSVVDTPNKVLAGLEAAEEKSKGDADAR